MTAVSRTALPISFSAMADPLSLRALCALCERPFVRRRRRARIPRPGACRAARRARWM